MGDVLTRGTIPAPLDHLANWPTMVMCPQCSESLTEADRPRTCPQCAFAYDADSFSVPVWSSLEAYTPPWAFKGIHGLFSGTGLVSIFWGLSTSLWFLIVLGGVSLLLSWSLRPRHSPNGAFICGGDGVYIRVKRKRHWDHLPWDQFRDVIVRQAEDDDGHKPDGMHELAIRRIMINGRPAPAEVVVMEHHTVEDVAARLRHRLSLLADPSQFQHQA